MTDTIEVHAKFEGDPAKIIELMIKKGRASNRTEALRLAIMDYNNHHQVLDKKDNYEDEERFYQANQAETNKEIWDNEKDEKMVQWYEEQIKKGAYDKYKKK